MPFSQDTLRAWCKIHREEHLALLKTLAAIPAPSHHEQRRAEYILHWLKSHGAHTSYIDEADNVIFPLGGNGREAYHVFMAHTDIVFPDTAPLPVTEENGRLYAPGVGDDTANVAAMLMMIRYLLENDLTPGKPMLFVFDSCEEGLGNLKGVRRIMTDFAGKVKELVSFDLRYDSIICRAVGSRRWKIRCSTRGGHSFGDFGAPNAIACLSQLISSLYSQSVPRKADCTTTYNVGTISGGTSINTIAPEATATYECRSDDRMSLMQMEEQFFQILRQHQKPDVQIQWEEIGDRPCGGDVPEKDQNALIRQCRCAIRQVTGQEVPLRSGSTDANIPLSLGIPAVTIGLYQGAGEHTRQEYVIVDSLPVGLEIGLTFLGFYFDNTY